MIDIDRVRAEIPVLSKCLYFNTGGISPTPKPVTESLVQDFTRIGENGPPDFLASAEAAARDRKTRDALAEFFGMGTDEFAFTRGVSDGTNVVLGGMDWKPGDELIITDEEHPAFLLPALHLCKRRGLSMKKLQLTDDPDLLLDRLDTLLGPKTRLLLFSHATTDTGLRLPAEEICRLAHDRGVLVALDGAQSAGQFPVHFGEMGVDFYAVLGYKWLLGPYTAGLLYVRREHHDRLQVDWTGARAEKRISWESGEYEFRDGARQYEFGPFSTPLYHGLGAAVEYLSEQGLPRIKARVDGLTARFRNALRDIPGVRIHSPDGGPLATGIVTFGIEGVPGAQISSELRSRWNVIVRSTGIRFDGVRICVAFFNTEEELDTIVYAARTVTRRGGDAVTR